MNEREIFAQAMQILSVPGKDVLSQSETRLVTMELRAGDG